MTIREIKPIHVIPLVFVTGVSLLATDIYLPSIPTLPESLGGTESEVQLTLTLFFIPFAASQLLYGLVSDYIGEIKTILVGLVILSIGSIMAASSKTMDLLMVSRFVQGIGAAAGTAIIPAIIQKSYDAGLRVRMMSWLGAFEATIPAVGPFIGLGILNMYGWRASFVFLSAASFLSILLLWANKSKYKARKPRMGSIKIKKTMLAYVALLQNRKYAGYVIGYARQLGALLTFISAAPYLLEIVYNCDRIAFGLMQIVLVLAFIIASLISGFFIANYGTERVVRGGILLLVLSAIYLLGISVALIKATAVSLTLAMVPSQIGLGLRLGVGMSLAIGSAKGSESAASAMSGFLCFFSVGIGSALAAIFIYKGIAAISIIFMFFAGISIAANFLTSTTTVHSRSKK